MHALSSEDKASLMKYSSHFKVIVPLETLQSECDDGILKELFENMINMAMRYTESVCRWQRMVVEKETAFDEHGTRQAIEDTRRTVHTAFIDHVKILSRTMVLHGKKIDWRDRIGKLEDRSAMGRFALTISFEYVRQLTEKEEGGVR